MSDDGSLDGEILDGEIFDATDTGSSQTRRGGPMILVAVAAAATLVVGVVVTRPGEPGGSAAPPSSPPPATGASSAASRPPVRADDVLNRTGIGRIQLGMSGSDYRKRFAEQVVDTGEFFMSGGDAVRNCIQYSDYSQSIPTYVWVRDDEVVTVGVALWPGDSVSVATAFGATVGEEFDVTAGLAGWQIDTGAPVPIARLVEGDSIVTLADTQADGVLDFASVGSVAGDECQVDDPPVQMRPGEEVPALEVGVLLGLSLGMSVEQAEALPDWTLEESRGSCSMLGAEWGSAYLLDGVVIGMNPLRVLGGPSLVQTVDEAVAGIGADRVRLGEPRGSESWWTTDMTVDGETTYQVQSNDPMVPLDGLDVDVMPPVPAGERIINTVLLGDSCTAREGS